MIITDGDAYGELAIPRSVGVQAAWLKEASDAVPLLVSEHRAARVPRLSLHGEVQV